MNIVVKLLIGTERKVNDMPRYIDADALLAELQEEIDFETTMYTKEQNEYFKMGLKCAFRDVKNQPTADVVPRAEVAREIFAEIEKIRAKEIRKCEHFRQKENDASERKYWEGGEHSLCQLSYWIADLKNKYTEEQI